MVFFESAFATVAWNEDINAVFLRWKCTSQGEQLRRIFESALKLMVQKNASKWLIDARRLDLISLLDQVWISKDFYSSSTKAGARYIAAISLEGLFSRRFEKTDGCILERFETVADAEQWLSGVG